MVRVSIFVAALALAISEIQALPAQAVSEKRPEAAANIKTQLTQLSTALQQLTDTPATGATSSLSKNGAIAGAMIVGVLGALFGSAVSGHLPPNTTFTPQSIIDGLTTEMMQAGAAANDIKKDGGLSIITSLLPTLGALMNSQPNLQRGDPSQQGSFTPPPLPSVIPSAPKSVEPPKPAQSPKPADSTTGMDMGPPPTPGPPKPALPPTVAPAEPKSPNLVAPSVPSDPMRIPAKPITATPVTPEFPGLENAAPVAASAPVVVMSEMKGMGGHGHGAGGHGERIRK